MPIPPSYPGVDIKELPNGVRTITGVPTTITAFIGSAAKGLTNQAIRVNSYSDFERKFGGLSLNSTMSYAVRDFYLNGGGQAVIVRIHKEAQYAEIELNIETPNENLKIRTKSPGGWGNKIAISINHDVQTSTTLPGSTIDETKLFNLIVHQRNEEDIYVKVEEYLNVSLYTTETNYLPKVLQDNSALIEIPETVEGSGAWAIIQGIPINTLSYQPLTGGTDGTDLTNIEYEGSEANQTGLYALKKTNSFNLLCIPPPTRQTNTPSTVYQRALRLCNEKRAILLVDAPTEWGENPNEIVGRATAGLLDLGISGVEGKNAAIYFPRVRQPDPLMNGQIDTFVPCGLVAGCIVRTDTNRGVWKAPAGINMHLNGISGLHVNLSDSQNGLLASLGINCLRNFPSIGKVIWGARTLRGADTLTDEYKYLPVRRLALYIEESLFQGLKWAAFESNDEQLWAQIRLCIGAFMHDLFRQGAFQANRKEDAYFVKCDAETTNQNDINSGIVNIVVGFAPLKPAEFVILRFHYRMN